MPLIPKQQPPYYNTENITVKTLKGLATQSSTSAPTIINLINTIGNIIWTRDSPGFYIGTLTGAFPINKTWGWVASNAGNTTISSLRRIDDNTIALEICTSFDGAYDDGLLTSTSIYIEIYP